MSETREEYMRSQFESRRVEVLRDMTIGELLELCPDEQISIFKEDLIEVIIDNVWDKQINEEVK